MSQSPEPSPEVTSATPPRETASGTIAYLGTSGSGHGQAVFSIAIDGSRRKQLTHILFLWAAGISFSPDGRRIVFARGISEGRGELEVMDADGGGLHRITSRAALVYNSPVWSPDGSRIAFASGSGGALDLLDLGSTKVHQVVGTPANCSAESPSWSPAGTRLVFEYSCNSRTGPGTTSIQVIGANGTERRTLIGPAKAIPQIGPSNRRAVEYSSPAWSPDGTRILFVETRRSAIGVHSQIDVIDTDGSHIRRLTHGDAIDATPTWSPDGAAIAFMRSRGGTTEVYVMEADGTGLAPVTHGPGVTGPGLAWRPD